MSKKLQNLGQNASAPTSASGAPANSAQLHSEIKFLREKITQLVEKTPQKAAILMADWMRRPANRGTYKKVG